MDTPRSPRLAPRLLAEFFVIVVGVMVALAADRWLMTLDDRDLERGYVAGLIEDVRADAEYAAARAASAQARHDRVLELLAAAEDPGWVVTDTVSFVVGFETDAWSIIPDFHTTTWTDLVSTGNLRVIRERGVRRALSEFYDLVDVQLSLEREWDAGLARFEDVAAAVNPPGRRLELVRGFGGQVRPEVTAADLARVRAALASDPQLRVRLGQVAIIFRARAGNLRGLSSAAEETLETLLDYSERTGAQ